MPDCPATRLRQMPRALQVAVRAPARAVRQLVSTTRGPLVIAEFSIEPGFGFVPLAYDSDRRHAHDFRGFVDAQSATETQLDDATLAFVHRRESFQGFIKRQQGW